jgi:hypothetical protein
MAGKGMPYRTLGTPVFLVPGRRSPMYVQFFAGLSAAKLREEHLAEQPVVPVPQTVLVLRYDEQIPALDLRQPSGRPGVS